MSDTPQHPLTDQTLTRFRRLADGNGLTVTDISLVEALEQIYTLEATLTLTPHFETDNGRYPGPVRGKDRHVLGGSSELKQDMERRKQEFTSGTDWIPAVINELRTAQGSGWGYNDATISLADKSVVLAASTPCPHCQGRQLVPCQYCQASGQILCPQCQGRRQEPCAACGGHGEVPGQPGQACSMCQGTRLTNCRTCQARGHVACRQCQGRAGTPCPACEGAGQITEEIGITCGAKTSFKLKSEGLPSGLRRGLDRLEFVNLSKGHADIEMLEVKAEDEEDAPQKSADGKPAPPIPKVNYRATLPYADIKVRFGQHRPALISVFGKRGILSGVPAFLDEALEPWRVKLKEAAKGKIALEEAMEGRAIREAVSLEMTGKGSVRELRHLYSIGLSSETAQEILTQARLALNFLTLRLRGGIAAGWLLVSAALFGEWFLTSLRPQITEGLSSRASGFCDGALLFLALILGWFSMSSAIHYVLQRRFPKIKIPLQQKIGKLGFAMLGSIFLIFVAMIFLAPIKPTWLVLLLHRT